VDEFARQYLFQPLGITRFEWAKYPGTDLPAAASGLRLTSRDLLKFGLLYSQDGHWQNKQVVPAKWVEESCKPHVQRPGGSYGYQFWLWQDTILNRPTFIVACVGNGDQRIFLDKARDLVIVLTAGNYNKWNIKNNAGALVMNYVYPALKD
jgi:CubicO group peptidase (beta-lactamase class C family)